MQLEEPLVTAGWFHYENIPGVTAAIQWTARWHGYAQPSALSDGQWVEHQLDPEVQRKLKLSFTRVRTFGRPLISIADASALDDQVLKPLLADIGAPPPVTQ